MKDYLTGTKTLRAEFERALTESIEALPMHPRLQEAVLYAVDGGGKRLRPVLLLECCRLFGHDGMRAMPYAVALEMIHNYSLVHDDLPAMDDDDTRRGRPTVHRAFDEGLAVLAGDALLNGAYEIALKAAGEDPGGIRAVRVLAVAAGTCGMLSGQVMDLYDEVTDRAHLLRLYHQKTGRLILAACEAGGILGGADAQELSRLSEFARHLGAAFQIQDDLLDARQDLAAGNMSILRFTGEAEARENMREHTDLALKALAGIERGDTEKLSGITRSLMNRAL